MNDHTGLRFATFAMFAGMAALLLYWFHEHLRLNVICIAAAIFAYGINAFMLPPFAGVKPLGSKQLRACVVAVGLVLMALGIFL